jgi:hypothetical protein
VSGQHTGFDGARVVWDFAGMILDVFDLPVLGWLVLLIFVSLWLLTFKSRRPEVAR